MWEEKCLQEGKAPLKVVMWQGLKVTELEPKLC
jgi:hypothetical protein